MKERTLGKLALAGVLAFGGFGASQGAKTAEATGTQCVDVPGPIEVRANPTEDPAKDFYVKLQKGVLTGDVKVILADGRVRKLYDNVAATRAAVIFSYPECTTVRIRAPFADADGVGASLNREKDGTTTQQHRELVGATVITQTTGAHPTDVYEVNTK